METPQAILIGLSLIAAAIFFKDTGVNPAYAYGNPATKSDVTEAINECLNGAGLAEYFFTRIASVSGRIAVQVVLTRWTKAPAI